MINPSFPWVPVLLACGILAGCGGGSGSDTDTALDAATENKTTAVRPSTVTARNVNFSIHDGAEKTILPEDFHHHHMKAFHGGWHQSYANVSLKFLISAIGPQKLLNHLENLKKNTQQPDESKAVDQFIDIIHKAYISFGSVNTQEFVENLQNLAPFNKRNAAGDWEFELKSDVFSAEKKPEQFLPLISEIFHLDTLPGWSFDIQETYVYQGEERVGNVAKNRFQMFQPVHLDRVNPQDVSGLNLQKLIDLLHSESEEQVIWNAGDARLSLVKVISQVSIANVKDFDRLSISFQGDLPGMAYFTFTDPVTLPIIDQQTKQKSLLTLTAKEVIAWDQKRYTIRIKNSVGQWMTHEERFVRNTNFSDEKDNGTLINFAVVKVAPLP